MKRQELGCPDRNGTQFGSLLQRFLHSHTDAWLSRSSTISRFIFSTWHGGLIYFVSKCRQAIVLWAMVCRNQ